MKPAEDMVLEGVFDLKKKPQWGGGGGGGGQRKTNNYTPCLLKSTIW